MPATATDTALTPGTWTVDPVHSNAGFSVRHMVVSRFRARFTAVGAELAVQPDGSAKLVGTVRADSVDVKDPDLAAHLASAEFFDAGQHPELRFESTRITRAGDEVTIDGRLTIKGRTHDVTATGTVVDAHEDPYGDVRLGLELETVIDRRDYGLEWNMPLPKGGFALSNEVTLQIDLEFTRS